MESAGVYGRPVFDVLEEAFTCTLPAGKVALDYFGWSCEPGAVSRGPAPHGSSW